MFIADDTRKKGNELLDESIAHLAKRGVVSALVAYIVENPDKTSDEDNIIFVGEYAPGGEGRRQNLRRNVVTYFAKTTI